MSIIHNALKKVQQRLTPKIDEETPLSSEKPQDPTGYLYANTPPAEPETPKAPKIIVDKPVKKNILKSLLALLLASAISAGSFWYIYQEFRNDVPMVQRIITKWFYHLINKEDIPEFKSKRPQDLKPLASISFQTTTTANPRTDNTNDAANYNNTPANTAPAAPTPSITLNVHGIMSKDGSTVALINDQVYQEGDDIEGAKILKINSNSITIRINGQEKTISVDN